MRRKPANMYANTNKTKFKLTDLMTLSKVRYLPLNLFHWGKIKTN